MQVHIKAKVEQVDEIEELVQYAAKIEKGCSGNCTLLKIEVVPTIALNQNITCPKEDPKRVVAELRKNLDRLAALWQ